MKPPITGRFRQENAPSAPPIKMPGQPRTGEKIISSHQEMLIEMSDMEPSWRHDACAAPDEVLLLTRQ